MTPLSVFGQSIFQIEAESGGGYKYNIFNAGPAYLTDSLGRQPLEQGGFQYTRLNMDWDYTWKSSKLLTDWTVHYDYFPSVSMANLLRADIDLRFQHQINKQNRLFTEVNGNLNRTQRGQDPTAVFGIPTTYQNGDFRIGTYSRLQDNLWITVEGNARIKKYAATPTRQWRYMRYGGEVELKNRFKSAERKYSYLYTTISWNQRDYIDLLSLIPDHDETLADTTDQSNERRWQYQQIQSRYKFPSWGAYRLETSVSFLNRSDLWQNRLGYQQWRIGTKLTYRKGPWYSYGTISYTHRPYRSLMATSDGEATLLHRYLRAHISAAYRFHENWQFNLKTTAVKRWRNEAQNATTFLPYFNMQIKLGLRGRF